MNKEKAMALRIDDRQTDQSTLDEVASFVEYALPVLMALVKKGAKYSEESLLQIRPSFRVSNKYSGFTNVYDRSWNLFVYT